MHCAGPWLIETENLELLLHDKVKLTNERFASQSLVFNFKYNARTNQLDSDLTWKFRGLQEKSKIQMPMQKFAYTTFAFNG